MRLKFNGYSEGIPSLSHKGSTPDPSPPAQSSKIKIEIHEGADPQKKDTI
jgi:hypothetical protein